MKLDMSASRNLIVAMVGIAVLAAAFWMLLLSPKREEADKLGKQVEKLEASLAGHEAEVAEAQQARDEFPSNYEQLVVLGKAVPADDDTASLIVQLNQIAEGAGVRFRDLKLASEGGEVPVATEETVAPEENASPTEVAASTLPLGATIGPAGLGVMPYDMSFEGEFFEIADFINGLDELVKTENAQVSVNGRLFTINGFTLEAAPDQGFPALQGSFSITTYLTPPSEGVTAGATPTTPGEPVPASATVGGTP
ncbi:MAG: type 4a pilus biogenesis protein PilO [Actinomycetota bacterium]|nr:type 4a pilus biogenesis protein PilO [Actinomycetota bacterium]